MSVGWSGWTRVWVGLSSVGGTGSAKVVVTT